MPVQPRTPPGVMELLPPQQLAFQRMLDTIRRGFERILAREDTREMRIAQWIPTITRG